MSISIDKDKSLWLRSIISGMYTHDNQVNLFTNGLGYHHPLFKYSNITGFPTLFVLKNATMFAPTPYRPILNLQGQAITEGAIKKIIQIIGQALSN